MLPPSSLCNKSVLRLAARHATVASMQEKCCSTTPYNPTPKRARQVDLQLSETQSILDHFETCLADLSERLQPILSPKPVDQVGGPANPPDILCPLAERIRNLRCNVSSLMNRVENLANSIEL